MKGVDGTSFCGGSICPLADWYFILETWMSNCLYKIWNIKPLMSACLYFLGTCISKKNSSVIFIYSNWGLLGGVVKTNYSWSIRLTRLHSKAAALCSSRWRKQWLHLLLLKIFGENLRQSEVRVVAVPDDEVGGDGAPAAVADDMFWIFFRIAFLKKMGLLSLVFLLFWVSKKMWSRTHKKYSELWVEIFFQLGIRQ